MLSEKTTVKISVDDEGILLMLNGPADDVLAKGIIGFKKFLKCVAKRIGKPGAAQAIYNTVIDTLQQDLMALTGEPLKHCTCKAEPQSQPEEPTKKRMTPEEFMAFYNAWMSQASAEERDRFIKLNLETIAERIVKPY